jgi:hypothetical protein
VLEGSDDQSENSGEINLACYTKISKILNLLLTGSENTVLLHSREKPGV